MEDLGNTTTIEKKDNSELKKWFWDELKSFLEKMRSTAGDSFGGILGTAKDLVMHWASEVKKWAKTVTNEIKDTETVIKLTQWLEGAKTSTINNTKWLLSSALNIVSEAAKPTLDPEIIKLASQVNIQKIADIIWSTNIVNEKRQWSQEELLVSQYNLLVKLIGDDKETNREEVNKVNKCIDWLLDIHNIDITKIDNINPVRSDLNKLSSEWKISKTTTPLPAEMAMAV